MSKSLNVRVVGRGTMPRNYDVYDADTGEKLDNVLSVRMNLDASEGMVTAEITVAGHSVEFDVNALADVEESSIEMKDGETVRVLEQLPRGAKRA